MSGLKGRRNLVPGLRAGRRWTPDEDDLLSDLLGTMPTQLIAVRLGRSLASVWARCSDRGISPYSEDGDYTASELARILGIPTNNVRQWCMRRYVVARRIGDAQSTGAMWRIRWDARRPLPVRAPVFGRTMRRLERVGLVELQRSGKRRTQSASAVAA